MTKHVFIVGLPRTGTKLAKNILQRSPYVCCRISNETWFFGDLFRRGVRAKLRRFGDLKEDANVRKLVDYLYSGQLKWTYWKAVFRGRLADREWTEGKLLKTDRSEKAIYEVIMEASLARELEDCRAKEWVLGDKTPGHLYHVPKLFEWFPDAKVIHTFRDPRAIAASEWKRLVGKQQGDGIGKLFGPAKSFIVIMYVIGTWRRAAKLHGEYQERFKGQYYLSRYEDLVSSPKECVGGICRFIGLNFSDEMLTPAMVGSSFSDERGAGFDRAAIDRWRAHIQPWMNALITLACRKQLEQFGYRP